MPETKTYRGATLEELLPTIRAELGPDAVITRQREGLVGGVGGFFQKKCVEVEAAALGSGQPLSDDARPARGRRLRHAPVSRRLPRSSPLR